MKLPWQRVKDERVKRVQEEGKLAATQADWAHVHRASRELRAAYGPNGWTGIAERLFSGEGRRR